MDAGLQFARSLPANRKPNCTPRKQKRNGVILSPRSLVRFEPRFSTPPMTWPSHVSIPLRVRLAPRSNHTRPPAAWTPKTRFRLRYRFRCESREKRNGSNFGRTDDDNYRQGRWTEHRGVLPL